MQHLSQFMIILGVTFAGETMNRLLPFPVPTSIYGLLILFFCLGSGLVRLPQVERAGDILLSLMPLAILPAGAGIAALWEELRAIVVPLLVISLVSTAVVMAASGRAAQGMVYWKNRRAKETPR